MTLHGALWRVRYPFFSTTLAVALILTPKPDRHPTLVRPILMGVKEQAEKWFTLHPLGNPSQRTIAN